jgi:hypothetical protein
MKTTLLEAINGKLATAYTRSKHPTIRTTLGDQRTGVAILGQGIYCTYEFEDQQNDRMIRNYGEHLFKIDLSIEGFFVFDKSHREQLQDSARIYSERQLELIKEFEEITKDDEDFREWKDDGHLTGVANKYEEIYFMIRKNFKGCIFNREDDGRCLLIFDPREVHAKIVGKAIVDDPTLSEDEIEWEKS